MSVFGFGRALPRSSAVGVAPGAPAGPAIAITDRSQVPAGRTLLEVVAAVIAGGAHGVLVRERDLPARERTALVTQVARLCAEHDAALLVASPLPSPLPRLEVDGPEESSGRHFARWGLHLRRDEPVPGDLARATTLVGRSCHDLAELRRASDEGLDVVTISPVAQTASKPGHGPALGRARLRDLVDTVRGERPDPPAILALGGVDASNAAQWIDAGADGVAVMGSVMRADDPAATMAAILDSVRAATSAAQCATRSATRSAAKREGTMRAPTQAAPSGAAKREEGR